jgi:carboxyl-terminal processing protease
MEPNPLRKLLFPLFLGLATAFGIAIGYFLPGNSTVQANHQSVSNNNKMQDVMQYILNEYVDTLNQKTFQDEAITAMLSKLDPHSSYIPASELDQVTEQLEGNFDGIGVEFNIQRDTIMVVAAITGGPSEALGIQSGDRIVKIEGKTVAGKKITNDDVIKQLRGKSGTKVKVSIFRPGQKSLRDFTITRGKIPIYSLDASVMLDQQTGYIKISRFAATTYTEYLKAFGELRMKGMKKLILDLRDNPGGYLNAAVDLSDEFLTSGKKIVYTQGQARAKEEYTATTKGGFETGDLVVLIDEGSASASEIVSGAIQDNDRGWVVGRRSFGKGLVQEEVRFDDGSAMRLTIARYYTPTGRCIQRPYDQGTDEYYQEITERMSGTSNNKEAADKKDSLAYKTPSGRIVYGGGGVTPDVTIEADTSGYSEYLAKVVSNGLINRFSFEYVDARRKELKSRYPSAENFASQFPVNGLLPDFYAFAAKNGVASDPKGQAVSWGIISNQLQALIGRALYGNSGFYLSQTRNDATVKKALELLRSGKLVSRSQQSPIKQKS